MTADPPAALRGHADSSSEESSPVVVADEAGEAPRLRLHLPEASRRQHTIVLLPGLALPERKAEGFAPALAARLLGRGIAVVRPEPRHATADAASLGRVDWHTEVEDAIAAVRFAHSTPELRGSTFHLVGLSLGGIVAPIVAARAGDCASVASWAATARPWPLYAEDNLRRQLIWTGCAIDEIRRRVSHYRRWHELLVTTDWDAAQMLSATPTLAALGVSDAGFIGRSTQFWRQLCRFDAPSSYRGLRCAVLTARGSADCMCHPEDQQSIVEAASSAGLRVEARTLAGLDHGLRAAASPAQACTRGGEGPPAVGQLAEVLAQWVVEPR